MSEERNTRKVYQGRVVSDKMNKTITVAVDTYLTHAVYGSELSTRRSLKPMMKTIALR